MGNSFNRFNAFVSPSLLFQQLEKLCGQCFGNVDKTILGLTEENSSPLVSGVICVALAATLLYHIINMQINKGVFKKISADKFTIEVFEGSEVSYFGKYLNEVLYLFDQCAADVIVFEDMDRYNANRIFERLREVNYLINVQRSKQEDAKPLRFF